MILFKFTNQLLILLFIFLFSGNLFSQETVGYFDRKVLISDSLEKQIQTTFATDGVIDADEYKVGPGDILQVSIRGIDEILHKAVISPEGYAYLPKIGGVNVKDCSLNEAKTRIFELIKNNFKNVEVFINLIEFKKIIVGLYGDVKKPGSFRLPGNSRLSDLISVSEGLNTTSDLRNVRIISNNGQVKLFDYLSFIRLGNKVDNPILREGDFVKINRIDKTVGISGSIKYPGIYEFKENETAVDLIRVAGGFFEKSEMDSIEIISFYDDKKTQFARVVTFENLKNSGYLLRSKDRIIVREKPQFLVENLVIIDGYVKYPGVYKIIDNKTPLSEIIAQAGGFLENASIVDATLIRKIGETDLDPEFERLKIMLRADMTDDEYDYLKSKSRQRQGKVVVDFVKLFNANDFSEDVLLRRNDVINVPEAKNYITIIGQAVNPGKIPFKPEYKVSDYINLAGGFGWRAKENQVRVVKVGTGEWIDAEDVNLLEPGDTIWIPEDPPPPKFWEVTIDVLTVLGQVATVIAATVAVIVSTR